jgi:hypothetical protein
MGKQGWAMIVGIVMIVGGLAMYVAFMDTETSVVGLRQAGLVIAVLGAIDVVVTGRAAMKSRQSKNPL